MVTNPALDREREIEHFSTRTVLGVRPPIRMRGQDDARSLAATRVELGIPVLLGGERGNRWFPGRSAGGWPAPPAPGCSTTCWRRSKPAPPAQCGASPSGSGPPRRWRRRSPGFLRRRWMRCGPAPRCCSWTTATPSPETGSGSTPTSPSRRWTGRSTRQRGGWPATPATPVLAGAALRRPPLPPRRGARPGAGCGRGQPLPHAGGGGPAAPSPEEGLANLLAALRKGMEKVISTLGIHELRGYARCFSHIGLRPEVAAYFAAEGFVGSEQGGLSLARLKADADERYQVAAGQGSGRPPRTPGFWPRLWKAAGEAAADSSKYADYLARLRKQEQESPVCLRHLLDFRPHGRKRPLTAEVDTTVDGHRYPITISGMSFGSQGETAFRVYAEAARRLNIVCMNGEGGEIPTWSAGTGGGGASRWPPAGSGSRGVAELQPLHRDQDRPGRQARRGRPPARGQGLRQDRPGGMPPRGSTSSRPPTTTTSTRSRTWPSWSRSCAPSIRWRRSW